MFFLHRSVSFSPIFPHSRRSKPKFILHVPANLHFLPFSPGILIHMDSLSTWILSHTPPPGFTCHCVLNFPESDIVITWSFCFFLAVFSITWFCPSLVFTLTRISSHLPSPSTRIYLTFILDFLESPSPGFSITKINLIWNFPTQNFPSTGFSPTWIFPPKGFSLT